MQSEPARAQVLQSLLDSFVAITAEREDEDILESAVDLARLTTQARFGAAVKLEEGRIGLFTHKGLTTPQLQAMPHLPEGKGMLRAVLTQGSPIRLDVMQEDERSVGFPLGHVPMAAFLGVPIHHEGKLLGGLYLTKPPGQGTFSEQDELFILSLANQVAVALESARLMREQEVLNEELRVANQLKSDFVSMASHELRTPLTSIVGFASAMLEFWEMTTDEEKHEYVQVIDRQGQRLLRLVNDLLAMSRIEAGALETRKSVIRLAPELERTVAEFSEPGVDISIFCPDDREVVADPDHLHQIVLNYISNAVRYGEPPISVEVTEASRFVEIRVRDSGPGVPEAFLPRLFEKFTQAETGTTRSASGTGLGLSIVRGLAAANGGEAAYEKDELGPAFVVRLPKP